MEGCPFDGRDNPQQAHSSFQLNIKKMVFIPLVSSGRIVLLNQVPSYGSYRSDIPPPEYSTLICGSTKASQSDECEGRRPME